METIKSFQVSTSKDLDICPIFSFYQQSPEIQSHLEIMKKVLIRLLPDSLPFQNRSEFEKWLKEELPLFSATGCETLPSLMTLRFLSKPLHSLSTETFYFEMIKRWLIPNEEVNILSFVHLHFYFKHYLKESFFLAEAQILVRSSKEKETISKNLSLFKEELFSVVKSKSFARSILETKNLPLDQKTLLVRESLLKLIKRFPDEFDDQILHRFAYAHAYTTEEFKKQRSFPHLTRLIASMYLIRSRLEKELRTLPEKRHMMIRFIQTKLTFAFGTKPVLGLVIGVNLFHQFEFFDQKHIQLSVQRFFPHMRIVTGSFQKFHPSQSPIVTLYIELEKEDGSRFFARELRMLREHLTDELGKRIEHLVPTLFMVRNEEEVMRNILMLNRELKQRDDHPQMMISFDHHSRDDLIFTVVLLRIKKPQDPPLQNLLKNVDEKVRFIPDRVQFVRYIDKDLPIEANVFRLQIDKLPTFLRMDFSVNLYLARQEVVAFLSHHIGQIRDYNGGLILKQGELLTQFKRLFQDLSGKDQELLENFFYSLSPIEAQATIPLNSLSFFFDLFLDLSSKKMPRQKDYELKVEEMEGGKFVVVQGVDSSFKPLIEECLNKKNLLSRSVVSTSLLFEGVYYLGYYIPEQALLMHKDFEAEISQALTTWVPSTKNTRTLRMATSVGFYLDPRLKGDMNTSFFTKLIFEGLMRRNKEGKPECAIAESYEVSKDGMRYTFYLRDALWSDGSPIVAHDFEYAWKKILLPQFATPFSSFFRPIKNARKAKRGEVSSDEIGVRAVDAKTLVVDLEYRAPYFIDLTAHALYSPVSYQAEKMHPDRYIKNDSGFVCNGPYRLRPNRPIYSYELEKNPYYWNVSSVYFDQVLVNHLKTKDCIQMFDKGDIDFVGFPFQSFDDGKIATRPIEKVYSEKSCWISINTLHFPFNNKHMRLAMSAALNRKEILRHYSISNQPSFTPLTKGLTQHINSPFLIQEDATQAKVYFKKALQELKISTQDLPVIILSCGLSGGARHLIADTIKYQWESVLGLQIDIEQYEGTELFDRMASGFYEVGLFKWQSWIDDPIYTLDAFRYRDEGMNFSNWEDQNFQQCLALSEQECDPKKRLQILYDAERMLIEEAPVIPLFYDKNILMRNPKLVISHDFLAQDGNVDLSQSYFEN